jgi:hypothetical protein
LLVHEASYPTAVIVRDPHPMAEATQQWLKTNVGDPSGKWGSKYSEIYKLTGDLEKNKGADKRDKGLIEKIYRLVNEWSRSAHSGAKTATAQDEKDRQQRQLNAFRAALQLEYIDANEGFKEDLLIKLNKADRNYAKELGVVREVVARMAESPNALLKNTGEGLQGVNIVMLLADNQNGAWNNVNAVMTVNPVLAYNHNLLKGLLVHEYHHKLNAANLKYGYLDEFVAHWKQFSITRPGVPEAQRVEECNERLHRLYPNHVKRWKAPTSEFCGMNSRLVVRLDDVGDFLLEDNVGARAPSAERHGCATA